MQQINDEFGLNFDIVKSYPHVCKSQLGSFHVVKYFVIFVMLLLIYIHFWPYYLNYHSPFLANVAIAMDEYFFIQLPNKTNKRQN